MRKSKMIEKSNLHINFRRGFDYYYGGKIVKYSKMVKGLYAFYDGPILIKLDKEEVKKVWYVYD